jgi:hypothetical protein
MHPAKANIVCEEPALRAAMWEGICFEIWRGAASAQQIRDLGALQLAYARAQHDRKFAHVTVVLLSHLTGLDGELRGAVEQRSKALAPMLRASAIVVPASGFVASLVRGLITGMTVIQRARVPVKVGASHDELMAWLAPQLAPSDGVPVTAAELQRMSAALLD